MIFRTNAEALLGMFAENLLPYVQHVEGEKLGLLFCDASACQDENGESPDTCTKCAAKWLQQPYTGTFDMEEGRIRLTEGKKNGKKV